MRSGSPDLPEGYRIGDSLLVASQRDDAFAIQRIDERVQDSGGKHGGFAPRQLRCGKGRACPILSGGATTAGWRQMDGRLAFVRRCF